MPIVMGGGSPNLSIQQILNVVKNRLISSWSETNPPVDSPVDFDNVHFNTDWYDDAYEFEVSVVHNTSIRDFASLGNNAFEHSMFIEIHIFVKQLTEEHPIIANNIEKEILRILMTNVTNLGNGISLMIPSQFVYLNEEDSSSNMWHSMVQVQ